jgi:hypothetical protein
MEITMTKTTAKAAALILSLSAAAGLAFEPASAMSYDVSTDAESGRVILRASGEISPDDLALFPEALFQALVAMAPDSPYRPLLILESGGGEPETAMVLGRTVREAQLDTLVPADGIGCHSACTLLFLGGVKRRIEGDFGIHAARYDNDVIVDAEDALAQQFDLQSFAVDQIAYAREMIGDDQMIRAALKVGSTATALVPDPELADWGIITTAVRPSQYLPVPDGRLASCAAIGAGPSDPAEAWLCTELDLARIYRQIELVSADLAQDERADDDMGQAEAFEANWRSCAGVRFSDVLPEAMELARTVAPDRRIPACIGTALVARLNQLTAMQTYLDVIDSPPALGGWVPDE